MILSDVDLKYYMEKKKLIVEPINEKTVRENGLDLSIGDEIGTEAVVEHPKWGYNKDYRPVIDSHNEEDVKNRFVIRKCNKSIHFDSDKNEVIESYFIIQPHTLNLLTTQEYVKFGDDIMGFCSLRSSVARHGFVAPITVVDSGFEGTLTIEVFYSGYRPFMLYVGDRFLHLIVAKTSTPVRNLYDGVYKGQKGVRIPKCLD